MIRTLISMLLLAAPLYAAGDLTQLDLPRLGPGDDYTYAVCPSVMRDSDGSMWVAATCGRLINGQWSQGYEQLRVYRYTDTSVSGWIVDDNRLDGSNGLFEICQTSIGRVGGEVVVAATTTVVPFEGSPTRRFGIIGTWTFSGGRWMRWAPIAGHSYQDTDDCQWWTRWLGDPVLLPREDGTVLYWSEACCDGSWAEWADTIRIPGEPVVDSAPVGIHHADGYLLDAAWQTEDRISVMAIEGRKTTDDGPPWGILTSTSEYPLHVFFGPGDIVGPSGVWGRNPAWLRDSGGVLISDSALVFESTTDLSEPGQTQPGEPVVYRLWLWGHPLPQLPSTILNAPRYVTPPGVRLVEPVQ